MSKWDSPRTTAGRALLAMEHGVSLPPEENRMDKYYGGFNSREDTAGEFNFGTGSRWADEGDPPFTPAEGFPTEDEILFASYGGAAYEGDAFVLFQRDGKLYEVHGGHCSCYGLEDQWEPEETTADVLQTRNNVTEYHFLQDHDATREQFQAVLDALVTE